MEISQLLNVNSNKVIKLQAISLDRYPCIITNYVKGCNLFELIYKERIRNPLQPLQNIRLAKDLCDAMIDLHYNEPPILHRDIKPENCLIKSCEFLDQDHPKKYELIVSDFGISKFMVEIDKTYMMVDNDGAGSPIYMPPERLNSTITH